MSETRKWSLLLAAALVLGTALVVQAAPPFGGGGRGFEERARRLEGMAAALGLDAESRAGLSRVMERAGQRRQALGRQIHQSNRSLEKLFEDPLPDREAVMAQLDELADLEAQDHRDRATTRLEIRRLLTPEQREKLVGMKKERRQDRRARLGAACGADLEARCSNLDAPEGFQCLARHREELSDACRDALQRHRGPWGYPGHAAHRGQSLRQEGVERGVEPGVEPL